MRQVAFYLLAVTFGQVVAENNYIPVDFVENIDDKEAWQNRIVSGWQAREGQHPHQVSLRMVDFFGTVSGCGGSVVARQWVVTSAHCTASRITLVVRAGLVTLTRPEMIVETTEFYNHPSFDSTRPNVVQPNDIALVKLPIRLQYSRNLRPIRIQPSADAFRNYDELIVYASGFGRTWTNGPTTEDLRWVYLRGMSNPACGSVFGGIITATTVCARYYNVTSQSVCQGDSGGPLVHVSARGEPVLVGVSSFVAGAPFGCHSGLPSGFCRPGPFHAWFQAVSGIDFENLNEEEDTTTTTTSTTTTTTTTVAPTTTSTAATTTTTAAPTTTTAAPNTTTPAPTTTTTTPAPNTTTAATTPSTTTLTTTTPVNTTTPTPTTTTTAASTTTTTTSTTPPTNTTTPAPPPEEDSEEEEDPELSELLKKLEVQVKVLVRLSKHGRNSTHQLN